MKYSLQIVPGTKKYVLEELLAKFPESEILDLAEKAEFRGEQVNSSGDGIVFESNIEDIDEFYNLFSPLRITKENGLIRNLFRREWKVESVPAGINPSLAYILCMIAKISSEDIVLDPFCGAGTIAITAAKYFNPKKVIASDLSGKAVDFTLLNSKAANLSSKQFTVFRSNVLQLRLQKDSITRVITNLPFGIRVGDHEQNVRIYKGLADRMKVAVRSGGRLVLYTQEKKLLEDVFSVPEFKLIERFDVEQGGLIPSVYVFKKLT